MYLLKHSHNFKTAFKCSVKLINSLFILKKHSLYYSNLSIVLFYIYVVVNVLTILWSVNSLATVKARTLRIITGCVKLPRIYNVQLVGNIHLTGPIIMSNVPLTNNNNNCVCEKHNGLHPKGLLYNDFNIGSITEKPFQIYARARRSIMRWYFSNLPKYTSNLLFVLVCPF